MPTTNIFAGSQGRVLRVGNVEGEVLEAWNSARGGATATGGFADGAMGNKNPAFGADIETTRGGDFQGYVDCVHFDVTRVTDATIVNATNILPTIHEPHSKHTATTLPTYSQHTTNTLPTY